MSNMNAWKIKAIS